MSIKEGTEKCINGHYKSVYESQCRACLPDQVITDDMLLTEILALKASNRIMFAEIKLLRAENDYLKRQAERTSSCRS
jgi:hypothetical protein